VESDVAKIQTFSLSGNVLMKKNLFHPENQGNRTLNFYAKKIILSA
jgi:hypothetical protein